MPMTSVPQTLNIVTVKFTRLNSANWPAYARYALAILYVGIATLARWVLPLDSAPYLLYMPGMFAIGFLLGSGPGIAATFLSALAALVLAVIRSEREIFTTGELMALILYLAISIGLVIICDFMRGLMARRREDLEAMQTTNHALIQSRVALEASEAFLRSTLESSPDCIKVLDLEARVTFMNDRGMISMEVGDFGKIKGCPWPDFWQGDGQIEARNSVAQAQAGHTSRFQGYCETLAGTPKWWDVVVSPILDHDGRPERLLAISRDITEQKKAEAQQRLLNHELGHRLKNMLAMVQAIANQTIKRAGSLAEARSAFEARLVALGKAQDILTGTQWESAEFQAVVQNALVPYGADTARFEIGGPSLKLSSRCALALSMALHELATNAVKYGALSNEQGRIQVKWHVIDIAGTYTLELSWKELGGPKVSVPQQTGFGSVMIERSLAGYFKGKASIEYLADGLQFGLHAPVTRSESEFSSGNVEILALDELT